MKAFPHDSTNQYGMDLRDYFAGQAMTGLLQRPLEELIQGQTNKHQKVSTYLAYVSYQMADAMMKARDK